MKLDFVVLFISQLTSFPIGFVSVIFCSHLGKTEPAETDLVIALFLFLLSFIALLRNLAIYTVSFWFLICFWVFVFLDQCLIIFNFITCNKCHRISHCLWFSFIFQIFHSYYVSQSWPAGYCSLHYFPVSVLPFILHMSQYILVFVCFCAKACRGDTLLQPVSSAELLSDEPQRSPREPFLLLNHCNTVTQ